MDRNNDYKNILRKKSSAIESTRAKNWLLDKIWSQLILIKSWTKCSKSNEKPDRAVGKIQHKWLKACTSKTRRTLKSKQLYLTLQLSHKLTIKHTDLQIRLFFYPPYGILHNVTVQNILSSIYYSLQVLECALSVTCNE